VVQPAQHIYQDANGDYYNEIINRAVPLVGISGDIYPIGEAQANGNAAGDIAVRAGYSSPAAYIVDELHAKTTWSQTVVNQSGVGQSYAFNFHIAPGGILAGSDNTGLWLSSPLQASYNIEILLDNTVIWNSAAALRVGKDGGTWHDDLTLTGTKLGRTYSEELNPADAYFGAWGAGYTFGGYDDVLDLGTLANNGSFTLTYLMEVRVAGPMFESGAYAAFGDPLNLSGGGMIGEVTPVPEPEIYALLLAGLGLIGWASRRRD
jgi:hypothetical protein